MRRRFPIVHPRDNVRNCAPDSQPRIAVLVSWQVLNRFRPCMSEKKKARAHKVKSRGVWIAPDLERKIKGEGGRRGLTEPPYSYYLHLADLVLKSPDTSEPSSGSPTSKQTEQRASEPSFEPPSLASEDLIPAPLPPLAPSLLLPKLNLPGPPKQPRRSSPPKLARSKPPKQQQRAKLSLPKPPKRK